MSESKARVIRDDRLAREREAAIKERAGDLAVVAALLYGSVPEGKFSSRERAAVVTASKLVKVAREIAAEDIDSARAAIPQQKTGHE